MPQSKLLGSIPPYVFWELDARRSAIRAQGARLVDLGIGSPDQPIPSVVVDALAESARDPKLSGYPFFRAHPAFLEAAARYLDERFAVAVTPATELIALAGSKEGIAEIVLAHCGPGDVVLVPEIYYPVYARSALLAGAEVRYVPLTTEGALAVNEIDADTRRRARVLIINYPGNPTTAVASVDELARLVEFARVNELLLVSDLAYSELSFDGYRVPSVLEVPGAKDVAVELHTCSKSFNMAGVRIAFAAGNAAALDTLDRYRSNIGYGVSTLSQAAGAAAFTHHREIVPPVVAEYKRRRDAAVAAFNRGGWDVAPPNATMYLWLPVPGGYDDWGWVDALMRGPGIVVTPGIAFGQAGTGRFRISLVQPPEVLATACEQIAGFAR